MASTQSIFPVRDSVEVDTSPETLSLDDADDVIDALTSSTARSLVERIYEEPATSSDLAASVDTSLQNVQYHLEQLREVGLIEVIDTWYSEKGCDMKVYGPTNDPLVIVAGEPDDRADVEQAVAECGP